MEKSHKYNTILFLLFAILAAYLLINTGIISDDFDAMSRLKDESFKNILIPKGRFYFIETPMEYFTHYIWYYFFNLYDSLAVNLIKIFYIILSFYMVSQFFKIYLRVKAAYLVSFLFIFFPSHDSTVYFFMLQYLTLSFAFYLYAYYLAYNNKLIPAFLLALAGSFISYGSPAVALALFLLFCLEKKFIKGVVLLVPNIIYSAYYVLMPKLMPLWIQRLPGRIEFQSVIKQFILQLFTFADAMTGPSMWLKIYYSFFELKPFSIMIGAFFTVMFYKMYREKPSSYNKKLVLTFLVLLFLSFVMFAVTGYYPQLAFNLGNRVTIFGSLVFAYLITLLPVSHKLKTLIFAILIFSILGISDHWKGWNIQQTEVITQMRDNADLVGYSDSRTIYVSGNQYSKYGPISHIEFLSESWVPASLFSLLFENKIQARSLNKRHTYKDGYLVDAKYKRKTEIHGYIYVYDSERNELFKLKAKKINEYIESLPPDNRHWVQIMNIKGMKGAILKLMPRLKYAL